MTRYESLFKRLKQQFARHDAFERRGKQAIDTILRGFSEYLEAPPNTCRVCRIASDYGDTGTYGPGQLAELRPDGKFVGCLTVSEASGAVVRFAFYVRVDEECLVLQSGVPEAKEFRVKTLDAGSLSEFYGHTLAQAFQVLDTRPEKLAAGDALKHPIGFVWPETRD
jgi:hypothetical protein